MPPWTVSVFFSNTPKAVEPIDDRTVFHVSIQAGFMNAENTLITINMNTVCTTS